MNSYAVFIRGINISGRNPLSMPLLKKELANNGLLKAKTFLNSGNIIIETDDDKQELSNLLTRILCDIFKLAVPFKIIESSKLLALADNIPEFAKKEGYYHNVIFIIDDLSPQELLAELGPCSKEEEVFIFDEFIYWSYDLKCYQKCNYWKRTAQVPMNEKMTIRTLKTIVNMADHLKG